MNSKSFFMLFALLLFIPVSFQFNIDSYIKSNYIIKNNSLVPITFQKTQYGWYYQNPNSPHQIYLKDIISKQDSIYYNYKSIKFKLTPEFIKAGTFLEYSNPTKGTESQSREIGLNNDQKAIIYKNTFSNIDIGISADSRHFYEIVKINKLPLHDIDIYFKLNTNADIYYKKDRKFVKWVGETITTGNSIKIKNNDDIIITNPPKIWDSDGRSVTTFITLKTINGQKYIIKSIPFNSIKSLSFPIYNDLDITWETDETVFNSGIIQYASVSSFNSTHFVVAYKDHSNSDYGTARVGHFSGSSITWDTTKSVFCSGRTYYVSVSSFNSTHFVVAYEDWYSSRRGAARVGHFAGSSITWDTSESLFSFGEAQMISVSSLNQTHFVIAYRDHSNSDYGKTRIGHFNGSSITWDTSEVEFNPGYTNDLSVSSLNQTHFIVVYSDGSNSNYGTARVGHFNGSSIIWDISETVLTPGSSNYISVSSLDSTHFVTIYNDYSNSNYGTARVGHFTGSSITWDTSESVFNPGNTRYISVSSFNSTHFVTAYDDYSNSEYGTARVGHFTGSSITWDTSESVFNPGNTPDLSVSSLDSTHFVVAYRDDSNSYYGTARVGSVDFNPPSTSISPDGHSWTNQDVSFTLSCSDSGSGCNQTYYSIINNGDSCPAAGSYTSGTTGTVSCPAGSVCQKRVCYYSTDNVGNTEAVHQSSVFYIDKIAPSTTISPDGQTCGNDVSFTLSCSDSGSGCNQTYYSIINDGNSCPAADDPSYTNSTAGTVTCSAGSVCQKRVCYYSVDNVGNVEAVHQSNVFYIDKRVLFKINFTYHINTTSDPGNSSDVVYTDVPVGSEDNGISFFVTPTGSNFSSIEFAQGENYTISFNYLVGDKFLIGLTKAPWSLIKEKNYEVSHNRYLIQPFAYPMFTSSTIYVILMRPDININSSSSVCNRGYKTIFIRNNGRSNGRYNIRFVCE